MVANNRKFVAVNMWPRLEDGAEGAEARKLVNYYNKSHHSGQGKLYYGL